jgi:hypothetical protein
MLRDIADITGGFYYWAPTAAQLQDIYNTIFENIKLRLIQ